MSDCEKYQEMISCLLDGELTAEQSEGLRRHLESCAECKAVYDAFSALEATLENDLAEPPAELASGVMSQIMRSAPKKPVRLWRGAAAAACVVIVAAAAIGSGLFSGAKNAAPKAAEMAAVTESAVKVKSFGGTTSDEAAECAPTAAADGGIYYSVTDDAANGACFDTNCAEEERAEEPMEASAPYPEDFPKSVCGSGVPADASVPMKLCYEDRIYQYTGHTAVLPEGAQTADAEKLNDFYSGESLLGASPEIGLFFRKDDTLYVPDGNGEWNCYSPEK